MVRLNIQSTQARVSLKRAGENVRQRAGLFQEIRRDFLIRRIRQIFATNGDGTWRPTQRPNPILRDTYALHRSYTIPGARGNINRRVGNQHQSQLVWGSSLPYADIHEEGRGIVPRPVIGLVANSQGDRQVGRMAERWYQRRLRGA